MTAAAKLLDRLTRVKQTRPGAWASACPCCESRKGRPLAVTEKDDGRVLLHAFCGCETAAVLQRLGLTVNDLFERPLQHASPSPSRVPAGEVLAALSQEATALAVIASDMLEGRMDAPTYERLATAARRINHAADYTKAR